VADDNAPAQVGDGRVGDAPVGDAPVSAGQATRAHAQAAAELAEYFERAGDRSTVSARAEYGVLLAREKSARDQRDEALSAAGFFVPGPPAGAAPVEAAPVEAAPVEAAPVEARPAGT
jgi:hypothetical protein